VLHWRKRCRRDCWLKISGAHCALVGVGIYFLTELTTFILAVCALTTYLQDPQAPYCMQDLTLSGWMSTISAEYMVCKFVLLTLKSPPFSHWNLFTMDTGRFCMLCKIHAKWLHDNYSCSIHWVRKCRLQLLSAQNDPHTRSVAGN
jgi:hypothetical protein